MNNRTLDIIYIIPILLLSFVTSTLAQVVLIPDPGLNAAVREALQKLNGPLTQQDLLGLTNLNARNRNVRSIAGLEAAGNLVSLDLQVNHLTNLSLLSQLTNLTSLNLSVNPLTNFFLPIELRNLTSLTLEAAGLTDLTLPPDLTTLKILDLENNSLNSFNQLSNLTGLVDLDLGFNSFTNFSLPDGLTKLSRFYFAGNPLTNLVLPPGLAGMTELNLSQNLLTSFALPVGMTNLIELSLFYNQLTNLSLPADLRNLAELDLGFNQLSSLELPPNLISLGSLHLRANQFTSFSLPTELTALTYFDLSKNPVRSISLPADLGQLTSLRLSENTNLTSLTLPVGLTNLTALNLSENQLTNLLLPPVLGHLQSLNLGGNQLTHFTLPSGLTHLVGLFFTGNQLTNITLPPDMPLLADFGFLGNPLTVFVLPEPLAATNLFEDVAYLQNQGVSVFHYPLTIQLMRPISLAGGAFRFGITGPPGIYTVFGSTNLADWSAVGEANNVVGGVFFLDVGGQSSAQKFYRALLQTTPPDMVFVPPNTFTMGSPATDLDRSIFEGPQATVTLSRGFWIGKHEVTQEEYLAIMNENPSDFPGDLSRPVSSVSWLDATNYCWKLTQRELAAGRIPAGSRYRLPTEAEWECAARAGTSTRFSYGDDHDYSSLTNYAWFLDLSVIDLTVHAVGQKLPNPWGLYDMHGHVWEWCQDWYGNQPGGVQTDPTGPISNSNGLKVMRGGAYDYPNSSCRSASRLFFSSFLHDSDLGFRVVLATNSP